MKKFLAGVLATTMIFEMGSIPIALAREEDLSPEDSLLLENIAEDVLSHQSTAPTEEELPPDYEELPPEHEELPPELEELPPEQEELPPEHEELPPEHEELPPEHEALPPEEPKGDEEIFQLISTTEFSSGEFTCGSLTDGTVSITGYTGTGAVVNIPATIDGKAVTAIGNSAFQYNTSITEVIIPEGVTTIGYGAFSNCDLLAKITIPSTVDTINSYSNTAKTFNSPLLQTAGPVGSGCNIEFAWTESIPYTAFYGCTSLTTVTIPDGITTIEGSAFRECTALVNVTMPASGDSIGDLAFSKCTLLESITIPNGTTSLGNYAFSECNSISTITIPDGVTTIGYGTFSDCDLLAKITIPSTVDTINSYSNTSKTLNSPLLQTAGPVGSGCNIEFAWTESIPKTAFYGCTSLTSVTIPDGITTIGDSAFRECTALVNVTMPSSGYSIGDYAFNECTLLESITIPNGTTSLGNYAFSECNSISTITIPEGVTSIGYGAFYGCATLEKITIPSTVDTINSYSNTSKTLNSPLLQTAGPVGSGCNIEFAWTESIPKTAFYGCTSLTSVTIPDGITTIGDSAFRECTALVNVTMPASGDSIGDYAFNECTLLESITIPHGTTSLGNYAFSECNSISTITIPEGVTSIGYGAFYDCATLEKITIPSTVDTIKSYSNTSKTLNSPLLQTAGPVGSGCNIEFAWTESIPDTAFYGCTSLTSVTIPDGITTIGDYAFRECTALVNVTMPASGDSIGDYAFYKCNLLESITIPNGTTSLGNYSFSECNSISTIIVPDGVTSIGYGAFSDCDLLEKITIPSSVETLTNYSNLSKTLNSPLLKTAGPTGSGCNIEFAWTESIPNYVFYGCADLTTVTMPDSITTIGDYAFRGCSNLTTVNIPSVCETIGNYAFFGCSLLDGFTIPPTVVSIGSNAFASCSSLTSVWIGDAVTNIGSYAFYNCPLLQLYARKNSNSAVFAIDYELPFVATEPELLLSDDIFDRSASTFYASTGSLSINGKVNFTVDFEIPDATWNTLSSTFVKVKIPSYMPLDETTLFLNGQLCTDYTYSDSTGLLQVPVTEGDNVIKFTASMAEEGDLLTYASLSYRQNGSSSTELIGMVTESIEVLTLDVEDFTSQKDIYVDGIAPANETVHIYVDGVLAKTVTASKAGNYYTQISLGEGENDKVYQIKAVCQGSDGESLSSTQSVFYQKSAPTLVAFDFYMYSNLEKGVDLYDLATKGLRPNVTYTGSDSPMLFEVEFTNPEAIETVYVTSTKSNVKRILEAKYDEESGLFIAQGHFDESNHSYLPGALQVDYSLKSDDVVLGNTEVKENVENFMDTLWGDVSKNTSISTDTQQTGNVSLPSNDIFSESLSLDYDATVVNLPLGTDIQAYAENILGSTVRTYDSVDTEGVSHTTAINEDSNGDTTVLFFHTKATEIEVLRISITEGSITQFSNHMTEVSSNSATRGLSDLGLIFSNVKTVASPLYKIYGITSDHNDVISQIGSSPYFTTEAERNEAIEKAERLQDDRMGFLAASMVCTALMVGSGGLPVLLVTGLLGGMSLLSKQIYDYNVSQLLGQSYKVNWYIDPSGYVYDMETLERIEDVKNSVYCVLYDDETHNDSFWDNLPAEDYYGSFWDASEYNQENPLYTDHEGRYAWDVPEGWWRVTYEHEDYATAWSEWLPVPPPQLEVNVGLTFTGVRENAYTITLKYQDDSTADTSLSTSADNTLSELPTPTRTGYTFEGWFDAETAGTEVTTETLFTEDATIYAQWTAIPEDDSEESPEDDTQESPEDDSQESPEDDSQENPEDDSQESPEDDSEDNQEDDSDSSGNSSSGDSNSSNNSSGNSSAPSNGILPGMTGDTEEDTEDDTSPESEETPDNSTKLEVPVINNMTTSTFADLDSSAWYYSPIKYAYDRGMMSGTGDGQFSPRLATNRAMIVQVLFNIAGKPSVSGTNFTDVASNAWYANAVSWASSVGIVGGVGNNEFNPNGEVTREQLVLMLYGYEKILNPNVNAGTLYLPFSDSASINTWALEATSWAVAHGLVAGRNDGTFDPQATASRSEVAQILKNFVEMNS